MNADNRNQTSAWLDLFNQVLTEITTPQPMPKKPNYRRKTCATEGFKSYQQHLAHERAPEAKVMRQWIAVSPILAHRLFAAGVYHGTYHMKQIGHE